MSDYRVRHTFSPDLLDVFIVWVVMVSLAAVCLLVAGRFSAVVALVVGTVFSGLVLFFLRPGPVSVGKISFGLILVILLAVCFRAQPYIWIMGGQDPGTYVNMAAHYERQGSTFIKDSFRENLTAEEQKYYDNMVLADLSKGELRQEMLSGNYPLVNAQILARFNLSKLLGYASIFPGIYIKKLATSEYVFQFYPLHPIWMAIFSSLFGETAGPYSLPFFAVLTIVMLYRLAKALSGGSEKAGLLAAGFLAVNPLHAFFSKFPVTEVCFLFFTISGFYYLVKYLRKLEETGEAGRWYLPLATLLFLCAFLTRVTGFLYMPFFYLLALALFISRGAYWKNGMKAVFVFTLSVMVAYVVSVCYGLACSYPYTREQFALSIGKMAVANWQVSLVTGLGILLLLPFALKKAVARYGDNLAVRLEKLLHKTVFIGMWGILLSGAGIAVYRLMMEGKDAFLASTGVAAVSYLSPFAFFVLVIQLVQLKKDGELDRVKLWAAFFVTLFWGFYILVINRLPYQYYYARYLLSEVVPFSLLLVAVYLGRMLDVSGRKLLAYAAAVAITIYSGYFAACQFKGREADGAYASLKKVASLVKKDDLLFVTFNDFKLLMPFRYFFGLNAFRIEEKAIGEKGRNAIASAPAAWIIAKNPLEQRGTRLVDVIDYRQGEFEHVNGIPTKFAYINHEKLYLYRIDGKGSEK